MKTKLLKPFWLAALLLLSVITASAYDFMVDGIAYNYNDDGTTVTVTYTAYQTSYNYGGLSTANIPSSVSYNGKTYSVTSIGNFAFYQCSGLTSVTIPNSVTSIGRSAFWACNGLTSVHITDLAAWCNITFGDNWANPLYYAHHLFLNGNEVKDLVIPNSVTSIGNHAFNGCSGLTSVTIPNSVTSIGNNAFTGCSGLTSVTIPNSVTSIGEGAFRACSGLTGELAIPNSVTSIGGYAFADCSGLTSVDIPNSVTSIGERAFSYCTRLTSITIPNSVTSIGNSAFEKCSSLTSITIPNSVTSIGDDIFIGCSNLKSIVVDAANTTYDSRNSCNAIIETASNTLIAGCMNTIIPNSITAIGGGAFIGCSSLTSVTIPNSVTSIGKQAFRGCSDLTSVTIGNSVTSIGDEAFWSCYILTSINIPNSVTSIGYGAFGFCVNLTNITIPNSVTSISGSMFSDCRRLTSVTIPNSVTSIGGSAFRDCSGLTSITIPNSVTFIGGSAFQGCSGLTSVTIPNSVTSIGREAFSRCSSLTSVTIPNSVTSIGYSAFYGCSGLTSIYNHINHPRNVTLGESVFNGVDKTNCTLYVTPGRISEYSYANQWKDFLNIVEGDWIIQVDTISFSEKNLLMYIGNTAYIHYQMIPTDPSFPQLTWQSSNPTIATVNQNGKVTAKAVGRAIITATTTDGTNLSDSCFVEVRAYVSSIALDKDSTVLYLNETDTLTATVLPENAYDKTLNWTSSNEAVATVDQNGVVTALAVGATTITATTTDGTNLSDSCIVEVRAFVNSIALDKDSTVLYLNETDSLIVTILPEFASNIKVNWISNNEEVATVNQNGIVTALAVGYATITAATTDGSNLSDSCLVEVRAYASSLTFNKTQLNMYVGSNDSIIATVQPANAYNKTLIWQSNDTTIATVDQNGNIAAVGLGQATITATTTDGTNLSASCVVNVTGITSIALNKTSTLLYLEETDNLTATITPADVIINTIAWTSSNPSVASVNQNGKVTAHAVGTAIITATTADGTNLTASCAVEVRAYVSSVTLDKTDIEMYVGTNEAITATVLPENAYNRGLQWQTSNLSVASVDQNGNVTANGLGTAIIVAKTTDGSNLMATCEVNVTGITSLTLDESDITLFAGTSQTLVATISPSDVIVSTLQWQSSDPTVATVNQNGKVVALAAGTATITATTTDGTNLSASCQVTVWPQYALVAPGIEHTRGEQPLVVEYAVEMFNKNAITGLQFEIQLPEGVTLMNSSYGLPDMWLGDRARDHFIDVTELGFNHYQVLISSPTNKNFRNNSGDLVFMHLLVDQYHAAGIYNINVTNIIFTEADETEHAVADASYPVQYNYMLGDADANMQVIVADYITTALFITNRPTIRFYEDAANVHSANSAINVTDLTGIINIVLGIRPTEILHAPALGNASPAGSMEPEMNVGVKRLDADRWMMSLDLSNGQPMAAFQLDLKLPDGVTYESASVTDRTALLNVLDGTLSDGTVRLVVSAPSIDDIKAGNGEVLNITLKGNPTAGGMALFDNITLAERSLNSYELEPMTVPFTPTAIDGATLYNEVRIYGEKGNVVIESPVAGTAQLVLLNGIATPLEVQPGRNIYPVGKNEYYIVRFGSTTAKLKF